MGCEPTIGELYKDIAEVKHVLNGENEDGLVAAWQETKGAWKTIKWFGGIFGGLIVAGMVALFIQYVEAPFKYAKTEDLRAVITEQAVMSEKMGEMGAAFKDLTKELRNGRHQ